MTASASSDSNVDYDRIAREIIAEASRLMRQERQVLAQREALVDQSGSTLGELRGLSTRSVADLLVEVGDPRRFTEGGFARLNA